MRTLKSLAVLGLILVSGVKLDARSINTSLYVPDAKPAISFIADKVSTDLIMDYRNNIFTVSYINREGDKLRFEILDETGEILHIEKSKGVSIFHSRLSLATLPSGKYTAIIMVGEKEYKTAFSK